MLREAARTCEAAARQSSRTRPLAPAAHTPQDKDYAGAARLAFELRHPGRLLAVLRSQGPAAAAPAAAALARHMRREDLKTALEYCRWGARGGGEGEMREVGGKWGR